MTLESHSDSLSRDEARMLLVPHEVIRDPVQHDISITALERRIIDTTTFQRLRALKQLGPTDLVYPGAVHTRFSHSLGVLHVAEQLVQIANRNYNVYEQRAMMKVQPYPHLLIRLAALLHDVAHIPYGHTLEDEGNLAAPEWEDDYRAKIRIGDSSEIASAIIGFLEESGTQRESARRFHDDLSRYVLNSEDVMELPYPFVCDFVGNTLCADLLDYLDRDMYFCGLKERSGDRVVSYASVLRVVRDNQRPGTEGGKGVKETEEAKETKETKKTEEFLPSDNGGKGRVVLLTYRFEKAHEPGAQAKAVSKFEILSEAIDLLRRRFALAEKVYFHRTKLAASAMLISAMGSARLRITDIYDLSDGEFISRLLNDSNPRTKRLAAAFRGRRLYRPVYRINYIEERDGDPQSKKLWREKYRRFYRDPLWRRHVEERLEKYSNLPPGSVAVYCPDKKMNVKEFEMLVQTQPGGEVKELQYILDPNRRAEMDAINTRFKQLWSVFVYVDPVALDVSAISNQAVQDLSALCEHEFGFPNGRPDLQGKGRKLRDQIALRAIDEYEHHNGDRVPTDVFREMVSSPHRNEEKDIFRSMRRHLQALMRPASGGRRLKQKSRAKRRASR